MGKGSSPSSTTTGEPAVEPWFLGGPVLVPAAPPGPAGHHPRRVTCIFSQSSATAARMGAVVGPEKALRAVILAEGSPAGAAVQRLLYRAGFDKPQLCLSVAAIQADLARLRSDVVVVDLALCGLRGVGCVTSLVRDAQQAPVFVVVPFEGLRQPVLTAGASGVATPLDLRPLIVWLDAVRALAHAGLGCDCCRRRPAARRRHP